jgi:hypothetical protein
MFHQTEFNFYALFLLWRALNEHVMRKLCLSEHTYVLLLELPDFNKMWYWETDITICLTNLMLFHACPVPVLHEHKYKHFFFLPN